MFASILARFAEELTVLERGSWLLDVVEAGSIAKGIWTLSEVGYSAMDAHLQWLCQDEVGLLFSLFATN
jgi:hypothetical protein